MEEDIGFFSRNQSVSALNKFKGRMDRIITEDTFEMARNSHIHTIIHSMAVEPKQWDEMCGINVGWIGNQFIGRLSDESEELTKEKLDDIFAMCFRFLFELYLSIKNDLAIEFDRARRFATDNLTIFHQHAREQIDFAIREMPINIFKLIANSESIQSIKDFNAVSRLAETKRSEWEADLSGRENRVETLKLELSKYESGFNFVGLFQGFDDLSKAKEIEKNGILFWLRVVGFLIVIPFAVEIVVLYCNLQDIDKIKDVLFLSLVPTVSLVAIFVYYFRVLLYNYKSAKSQLLQIELRKTLCRFIQHYSEYSSKLKVQDKDSLSKFENIIFSGIVSDDGRLPSTYDGIEQLRSLVKSFKQ